MAQFLLITTLFTIAGLIATTIGGYLASTGAQIGNHILMALVTVLMGLFSQSMTMFFFIGTGKEIKAKAKGVGDEAAVVGDTRRFKTEVFPIAFYSMIVLMIAFIIGGGVHTGKVPGWIHALLAFASLAMYLRAYWVELRAMDQNARLMERFLKE
jgi:hypothetical protein